MNCLNCGENGHRAKECRKPVTSFGIICYKVVHSNEDCKHDKNREISNLTKRNNKELFPMIKYLVIQRKDTIGYVDFIRGRYTDNEHLQRLFDEMTDYEKSNVCNLTFDELWDDIFISKRRSRLLFASDYDNSKEKFCSLKTNNLINWFVSKAKYNFKYTEFSFPKGRMNNNETQLKAAQREFYEETSLDPTRITLKGKCFEEVFTGTNDIKYRHIYFLAEYNNNGLQQQQGYDNCRINFKNIKQAGEVKNVCWLNYPELNSMIRPYEISLKNTVKSINSYLLSTKNIFVM